MTIFEQILNKQIPVDVVYEDDYALAINDIAPQAPVHVLVIPKHPARDFSSLTQWDSTAVANYMQAINNVVASLNLQTDGYRLVFNTGTNGGQTVPYLHAHILAGKTLGWPPFPQ